MSKFIQTKQYKQFAEFCRACYRDKYMGLCYGPAGVGKTESARHYTKWYAVEKFCHSFPEFPMKSLHSIVYTPSLLETPRGLITDFEEVKRKFNWLKEKWIYGKEIPWEARIKNENFVKLVIIDEAERLKPQSFEIIREIYDQGEINFIFIGMPGIERILERFAQLYSRIGFVHQFKNLGKSEVEFIIDKHFDKLEVKLNTEDFSDQEALAAIVRITDGNFRLINRLLKQSQRIMKVNCMTTLTKEIVEAARSCLLIG
jgi:DNA transposition AAA+ family ATPase